MKLMLGLSPEVLRDGIKKEAGRRILEAGWTEIKQLNTIRAGGEALDRMSAFIDAIRAASNELEAMSPIPVDFSEDKYWPAGGPQ